MAVQQNRKTRSRRDMRRAHDALSAPKVSFDAESGEAHRRHRMTRDGFYRGRQLFPVVADDEE